MHGYRPLSRIRLENLMLELLFPEGYYILVY